MLRRSVKFAHAKYRAGAAKFYFSPANRRRFKLSAAGVVLAPACVPGGL